jgi:hypothetical protein
VKPGAAKADSTAAAPKSDAPSEDARALAAMLGRRYKLTEAQVELVAKDIDGDLQAGKRLRDAKLVNSDEPDMVFRPGDMPPGDR